MTITFLDLRALAETYDLLRLVIETRKDQIERMGWSLRPRQGFEGPGNARIRELTRFFHKPVNGAGKLCRNAAR